MSESSTGPLNSLKNRILVLCDHYLPSTKGGGGVWTVVNLVERFADRYDFFVITRNHSSRTDTQPFSSVKAGEWNQVGKAKVFYLPPSQITISRIRSLIDAILPDGVYLNSLFSKPVVKFLLFRRLTGFSGAVILAPCGELSEGALSLKRGKKLTFLSLARAFGLYSRLAWKASTELESGEIREMFGDSVAPYVAPDLPPKQILPNFEFADKPRKTVGQAKFIFYSRVDRKKNLLFALESFCRLNLEGTIDLTIVGPVDDEEYWRECEPTIDRLPKNINVNIFKEVSNEIGLKYLISQHFFILPTLGENFGYVILESLAAGNPVLLSERTIWSSVAKQGAGWIIPLDDPNAWDIQLRKCVEMGQEEYSIMSESARQIAIEWLSSSEVEQATATVLSEVIGA